MDILTPRGQQTQADERAAAGIFERASGCRYVETPKDRPAKVDAVVMSASTLVAVVETKCRYGVTREQLRGSWQDEWLVTFEKLEDGRKAAGLLGVPLIGFLYLAEEQLLLTQRLTDDAGQYCCKLRLDNTRTQKTCNGGSTVRCNAFIDMSAAKEWSAKEEE
jgi:hypothetical protein